MNKRKKMNFLRKNYVEKKNILNVHLIKIKEKENIDNIFYQLKLLIHSPQRIEAMKKIFLLQSFVVIFCLIFLVGIVVGMKFKKEKALTIFTVRA